MERGAGCCRGADVLSVSFPFVPSGDLTEDNMETENAAAAAAAAFTASSQLKEAVLGREPAFWQWRPQVTSEVVLPEDCLPLQ